jgi:hypothetical protein
VSNGSAFGTKIVQSPHVQKHGWQTMPQGADAALRFTERVYPVHSDVDCGRWVDNEYRSAC